MNQRQERIYADGLFKDMEPSERHSRESGNPVIDTWEFDPEAKERYTAA